MCGNNVCTPRGESLIQTSSLLGGEGVRLAKQLPNLHGMVIDYALPRPSRGTDLVTRLTIVDESCKDLSDARVLTFFKAQPVPPGVGTIVRLHRVVATGVHDGVKQLGEFKRNGDCVTQWVFGERGLLRSASAPSFSCSHSA